MLICMACSLPTMITSASPLVSQKTPETCNLFVFGSVVHYLSVPLIHLPKNCTYYLQKLAHLMIRVHTKASAATKQSPLSSLQSNSSSSLPSSPPMHSPQQDTRCPMDVLDKQFPEPLASSVKRPSACNHVEKVSLEIRAL